MRDFDSERADRGAAEQGFKIGGQQFRVRADVHPDVMYEYEDAVFTGRKSLLDGMDKAISAFLWDDGERKRWAELRARKTEPVTIGDLRGIMDYLYEVESQLPTIAPGPSSTGRGRSKPSSEAATSSPEETGP